MNIKVNWDAMGITASVACAIHCAVLPLLLSSLPLLGVDIIQNDFFEYGMIVLTFAIGIYSLSHGYRLHHHRLLPLVVFTVGILFLVAKQVWHSIHIWLLIPAVTAIVSAHYLNYRYCRHCDHTHAENCQH